MKSVDHHDCQTMYPSSRRLKRKGEPAKRRDAMGYKVTLIKGKNNMVGISIGGGSPFCPSLYVVQVFHRTPASDDGSLAPGDELVNVNGTSLQGLSRRETARIIQEARSPIVITYNKLQLPKEKHFDIAAKKIKHRVVEHMTQEAADTLGLTRAVLVNDVLAKKVMQLHQKSLVYRGIMNRAKAVSASYEKLMHSHQEFGRIFEMIGARERQTEAGEAFRKFGNAHRQMAQEGQRLLDRMRPMVKDLSTFIDKAVPDMKLTLEKYRDAKIEFLSYCLKVKEMDDEEQDSLRYGELLTRVLQGNYEYRVFLRCRHASKQRFMKRRTDVSQKLQLLDNKRVHDLTVHLERMVSALYIYTKECHTALQAATVFPFQMELRLDSMSHKLEVEDDDVESLLP